MLEMKSLFTPFARNHCDWFYWLSVMAFLLMAMTLVGGLAALFSKKMKSKYMFAVVYSAIMYFALYFQNRLLFTMCMK